MISVEYSFKWSVYLLFLLTLIFDGMGRLGQIGSIQAPCKILTLGTEIKKSLVEPFKVPIIKAEQAKNVFGGYFPTEHNGVTNYKCCWESLLTFTCNKV